MEEPTWRRGRAVWRNLPGGADGRCGGTYLAARTDGVEEPTWRRGRNVLPGVLPPPVARDEAVLGVLPWHVHAVHRQALRVQEMRPKIHQTFVMNRLFQAFLRVGVRIFNDALLFLFGIGTYRLLVSISGPLCKILELPPHMKNQVL